MFLELLHGRWGCVFRMLFFYIVKASPVWIVPVIVARIIDLLNERGPNFVFWIVGLIILAILLYTQNILTHYLYVKNISSLTRGIGRDLRIKLCNHIWSSYADKMSHSNTGRMYSKLIRDIEIIETMPRLFTESVVNFFLGIIVASITIALRSPAALLFFGVSVSTAVWMHRVFYKRVKQSVRDYRHSVEGMSNSLNDMIGTILLTHNSDVEEKQLDLVNSRINDVFNIGRSFDTITALFGASGWAVLQILQIIFLGGSVYAAFKGYITIGDVVLFNSFFMILASQLSTVLGVIPQLLQISESFYSVAEILRANDYPPARRVKVS